jgi:hypothetical protein
MNASHDGRDYPNIDGRVSWLAQVSDAATALAGTRVPEQFNGITETPKVGVEPVVKIKLRPLSARRDDSCNPNVPQALSHLRNSSTFAIVSGVLIILALIASLAAGQFTLADVWQQLVTDYTRKRVSSSSSSAPETLAISSEPATARLIVHPSRATRGEPALLGLMLQGPADGAVVHIKGLVPGMELSTGSAVGSDAWEIPASDLGYAWVAPPEGFVGSADPVVELRLPDSKIADRQAIRLEWVLPIGPAPVLHQLEESAALPSISPEPVQLQNSRTEAVLESRAILLRQPDSDEIAAAPSISLSPVQFQPDRDEATPPELPPPTLRQQDRKEIGTVPSTLPEPIQLRPDRDEMVPAELLSPPLRRQLDGEEITVLLKRGKDLITTGDLAAARLVLRRVADANNAEAALALAATYDPLVLRELKVYGFTADAATARAWYQKAAELGSSVASRRLEMLTQAIGTR